MVGLPYDFMISIIKNISIFNSLTEEEVSTLSKSSKIIKLKKGEILFSEKDLVNNIYIVYSGKVTVFRLSEMGAKRVIYILDKGEIVNEVIFDKLPASVSCEMFEDSQILSLSSNDMLKVMESNFTFNKGVIDSMGRKIRRLYRQLKNTVPIKMDKKLAAKLWKLSKDYGVKVNRGVLINLDITVTYLADMLGSSRETISRCISDFQKSNLIEFKDKKIIVKNRESLSRYFKGM
ncbi:Crp/Fnr family transcriptional regulator [Clostridium cochlearium]|jgi:CRP-like cAMP-binding protein|uniref:Crp/Fnr family transcriptional regulator n=2 Tax=Clostridium cochlearium TaxID=1494 RepID=A0A240AZU0_CLOCO|nr:Crp/Fnr family transcriptional regulator [Clostridium cochlearium]MBE6065153.1 Crp/Fnr family transcriptional regulator [Clostridium cochlearium]SDK88969.1 cAMP-binding domain of CRP or a regulatory subunit of cAMP-dependent protein kinases [Clostridium cochlearium]SNV88366.1 Crp/Fnr family transcriptional regulator [Clostridium cochlearium]SQB33993.1 Crp/Fnr family transcriptional regulator [Clostridium cochlearium]STA93664.1 Crp/Fnr family transcriptional regulator [Clostridium cochleariu